MHNIIISIYRVQNLVWPDDNKRIHAHTYTPRRPHRQAWLCQYNTPQEDKCWEKGKYRNVTIWLNGIMDNAKWRAVRDIKKKKKRWCETFSGFHVNIQFSLSLASIVERFIWCTPCTFLMSVPWHKDCVWYALCTLLSVYWHKDCVWYALCTLVSVYWHKDCVWYTSFTFFMSIPSSQSVQGLYCWQSVA